MAIPARSIHVWENGSLPTRTVFGAECLTSRYCSVPVARYVAHESTTVEGNQAKMLDFLPNYTDGAFFPFVNRPDDQERAEVSWERREGGQPDSVCM